MSTGHTRTASTTSSSQRHSTSASNINNSIMNNPVLGVQFNQEGSCFSVGLETGFRVYTSDPVRQVLRRDFDEGGGIGVASLLGRSNILALVGGGRSPRYAPNKVILYDEKMGKVQAELEFRSEVKDVQIRKDRMVICQASKVHIYSLERVPKLMQSFETFTSGKAIYATSSCDEGNVLAYAGKQVGHVCLTGIGAPGSVSSIIPAHEGVLVAVALDEGGRRLATASEKGTLIRVFDTHSGRLICELRRGADKAEIYSLAFSSDASMLCVASDKGTIHVFILDPLTSSEKSASLDSLQHKDNGNRQSSLHFIKDLLPKYFSSQWSFARCKVTEGPCIARFGVDPSTIIVVTLDGHFYRFRFDLQRGGECVREHYACFLADWRLDL